MASITNIVDSVIAKVNTHTTDITDIKESSLSKVASNVLLSGNLALASSAVTKSNANITYTGNGSTQSITTGIGSVDFTVASNGSGYYHDRAAGDCIVKNDAGTIIENGSCVVNTSKVFIKTRNDSASSRVYDGIRGVKREIYTNLTDSELLDTTGLTAFTLSGFTLSGADDGTNTNNITHIAYQTLYTHIKWGLTNQGKRYLTAYNPVTREVMTMYQGSGVAGHQIPNALGIKLDYLETKSLDGAFQWGSHYEDGSYLILNGTDAKILINYVDISGSEYVNINAGAGVWNTENDSYISYGFANSETKIITQYQGTGAAGNFVETLDVNGVGKRPRRVIIKRTDGTANWFVWDSERGDTNYITINTSDVEGTDYQITFNPNGFTDVAGSSASINASGGQYIAIVEFDTTSSNDDTYFDLPTDDTNLNVLAGKLPYTDGRDTTNGAYNVFTQSYTGSVDFSTCPDGIHYVALDSNNAPKFYESVAIGSYEKESADDNRLVFNTDDGKWYTTTGGELVTNGTFDTDTSGFTGAVSWDSNRLARVLYNTNVGSFIEFSTEVGEEYIASIQYVSIVNTTNAYIRSGVTDSSNINIKDESIPIGGEGTYTYEFIATTATSKVRVSPQGSALAECRVDNISVYKKEATLGTELPNPICFIDDKPYQVASGTPMDRLVDYPSIPKNVMESSYVDGDLEVSGEVKGKNQCTAWVNFDGTTTPPTIRDSYNVRDVVGVSTGHYEVYFEEDMDNTNGSIASVQNGDNNSRLVMNFTSQSKIDIYCMDDGVYRSPSVVQFQILGGKN